MKININFELNTELLKGLTGMAIASLLVYVVCWNTHPDGYMTPTGIVALAWAAFSGIWGVATAARELCGL